jgi:hypothetical protein
MQGSTNYIYLDFLRAALTCESLILLSVPIPGLDGLREMRVEHIMFGYNFILIGRDIDKMIDMTKELSRFAR